MVMMMMVMISFMVSWQGSLTVAQSGVYNFVISANGGFRFTLGGQALITSWADEIVCFLFSFLSFHIVTQSFFLCMCFI
jgi:hypothetical protein